MATNRRLAVLKRKRRVAKALGKRSRTSSAPVIAADSAANSSGCSRLSSSFSSSYSSSSSSSSPVDSARMTCEERVEMRRLSQLLPMGMQMANPEVDALQLVTNAAQYISQLTATVIARVQNGSLPRNALSNLPPFFLPASKPASKRATTGVSHSSSMRLRVVKKSIRKNCRQQI